MQRMDDPRTFPAGSLDRRASAEMILDKDHAFPAGKRHHRRKSSASQAGLRVPKLSIVMLVCGTRGDVQPFIALALKMKVSFKSHLAPQIYLITCIGA